MLRFSVLALAAALACTVVPAGAQPVHQPHLGDFTHGEAGLPTTTRPRFKIEAVDIHAINETGIDFLGDDEVIAIFESDGHAMDTGIYDMDAKDTKPFRSHQRCISPAIDNDDPKDRAWACDEAGRAGPADFTISLLEYDGPIRNFGGFCVGAADLTGYGCDHENSTQIGRRHVVIPVSELLQHLAHPGDTLMGSVPINACSAYAPPSGGPNTCVYNPDGGDYTFSFRITRTADETVQTLHPEAVTH